MNQAKYKYKKCVQMQIRAGAGLPDFSWYKIPKQGKIYQITTTIPNVHKI
jgi:hypothetical protein